MYILMNYTFHMYVLMNDTFHMYVQHIEYTYMWNDRGLIEVPIARGEGKFVLLQLAF